MSVAGFLVGYGQGRVDASVEAEPNRPGVKKLTAPVIYGQGFT